MLLSILLLTPVYISFFWSLILIIGAQKNDHARKFLAIFMIFAFIVYLSHFLYYSFDNSIYYFIDPFYQVASLMVYPLFYVYFRMLTLEDYFSVKAHSKYLFLPIFLFLMYLPGYLMVDKDQMIDWLYGHSPVQSGIIFDYLYYVRLAIKLGFILQLVVVIVGNFRLIKQYRQKQEQYYSNLDEAATKNINLLNWMLIVTSATSAVIAAIGKVSFQNNIVGLLLASIIFSTALFFIGWFGIKQESVDLELTDKPTPEPNCEFINQEILNQSQQKILEKVLLLFTEKKLYLNSKLNIMDVANEVGTNRTYLSVLINQNFNYNFCTFVNDFRMRELKDRLKEDPFVANQILCEHCGFGSVDSMRRVVQAQTGLPFVEWKKQFINGNFLE